tara:strand:+ start:639 stop:1208 length:570 start_codon:yes stop_codon:yes gene_type:complete
MYTIILFASMALGGVLGYLKHKSKKKQNNSQLPISKTPEIAALENIKATQPEIEKEEGLLPHRALKNMLLIHFCIDEIKNKAKKGKFFSLPIPLPNTDLVFLRYLGKSSWGLYSEDKGKAKVYIRKHSGFNQFYELDNGDKFDFYYDKELKSSILLRTPNNKNELPRHIVFSVKDNSIIYIDDKIKKKL